MAATPFKTLVFGGWGSGKTYLLVSLLEMGYKVFVLSTDIGGSGLSTVKAALKKKNKQELLNNLMELVLDTDDEVQDFLSDPRKMVPDIYDFDPDFLMWDGFGAWQQIQLSERIGSMPVERARGAALPEAVDAGLMFEQPQWGMLRNGTVRGANKFCALNNKVTGKVWHKFVTVQEGYKSKGTDQGGGFKETKMPLIQGAGGILMGGAFDLIIRTKKETSESGVEKFLYQVKSENLMSKNRGLDLPPTLDANMEQLWQTIVSQMDIKRGAVNEENKE